jgi:excisionase family DNA binding protein
MNAFLTVKQLQEVLGVSRGTVVNWIVSGRLRAFKPGGGRMWRVTKTDFQRFIKSSPDFAARFIKGENR